MRLICSWMLDEVRTQDHSTQDHKTQVRVPDSIRVKTEATNLWKELKLHLYFYQLPKQWADLPTTSEAVITVISLNHGRAGSGFAPKLNEKLMKSWTKDFGLSWKRYLQVFISEIHDEVEASCRESITETLHTAKAMFRDVSGEP